MSMISRTQALHHPLQQSAPAPQEAGQARPGTLMHEALSRREGGSQSHSAVEMALRGNLPLLSRDQRASTSDRFELDAAGSRTQTRDVVLDINRLAAAAGLAAPSAPAPSPRERIGAALQRIEFSAPAGPQREAQQALEAKYIDWAAGVLAAREKAFGAGQYSIEGNRSIALGQALLPAVYDGVRQFLSSSSRSPVASTLATAVGPRFSGTNASGQRVNQGELNNAYDPAVIGGAVGGASALAMDSTVLAAMDRRARLANLPQFKPVDLKALVPDAAPVQLRIDNGRKEYWEPLTDRSAPTASPNTPTLISLQEEVAQKRKKLGTVQDMLQAQSWGLLAQPAVTGAANVLRRHVMSAAALLQPGPVAVGSVIASGSAGAMTRFGLGMLKAPAYADVDNLVGGKQRLNLFRTQLPQPDARAATWSDVGQLPRRAGETLVEAGLLARHYVAGPWRGNGLLPSAKDVRERVGDIAHAVVANTFAAVFSTATGPLIAQIMRNGASAALPHETHNSPAYLLQQFAQSATNDFVWQAARSAFKGTAFNLAASLDTWRADRQVQLRQTALNAQNALPGLARQAEQGLAGFDQSALQNTLRTLQALEPGNEVQTATLRHALGELKGHVAGREGVAAAGIEPLVQHIETALAAWQQREAMLRWSSHAKQD